MKQKKKTWSISDKMCTMIVNHATYRKSKCYFMHTLYGYILCVVQILVPLPFFLGLRSTNKTPPINATPTTQPTIIKIMAVVDSPPKKLP